MFNGIGCGGGVSIRWVCNCDDRVFSWYNYFCYLLILIDLNIEIF